MKDIEDDVLRLKLQGAASSALIESYSKQYLSKLIDLVKMAALRDEGSWFGFLYTEGWNSVLDKTHL